MVLVGALKVMHITRTDACVAGCAPCVVTACGHGPARVRRTVGRRVADATLWCCAMPAPVPCVPGHAAALLCRCTHAAAREAAGHYQPSATALADVASVSTTQSTYSRVNATSAVPSRCCICCGAVARLPSPPMEPHRFAS